MTPSDRSLEQPSGHPLGDGSAPRLLRSSSTVAVGLGVAGAGTLVMLAATARIFTPVLYAVFATWWTTATLLGLMFGVFEIYLGRAVIAATSQGRDGTPVVRYLTGAALVVVVAVSAALVIGHFWLADRLFGGSRWAVALLGLFVLLMALQSLLRGVATARQQFSAIGLQVSSDGVLRAALTIAAAVLFPADVEIALAATCAAAVLSLLIGGLFCPAWFRSPDLRGHPVSLLPPLLLLASSFGALLINNGSVPWLAAGGSVPPTVIGAFAGALTLSRMPTQFLSAAFGPLMARLSAHVEEGATAAYEATRRKARLLSLVLGTAFVAAFTLLGPVLIRFLLGPQYALPTWVMAALAGASALMFVAVVEQAGLVADSRWTAVAGCWTLAGLVFFATLLVPGDPLLRASFAPLVAAFAAVAALWFVSRKPAASREPPTAAGLG